MVAQRRRSTTDRGEQVSDVPRTNRPTAHLVGFRPVSDTLRDRVRRMVAARGMRPASEALRCDPEILHRIIDLGVARPTVAARLATSLACVEAER